MVVDQIDDHWLQAPRSGVCGDGRRQLWRRYGIDVIEVESPNALKNQPVPLLERSSQVLIRKRPDRSEEPLEALGRASSETSGERATPPAQHCVPRFATMTLERERPIHQNRQLPLELDGIIVKVTVH